VQDHRAHHLGADGDALLGAWSTRSAIRSTAAGRSASRRRLPPIEQPAPNVVEREPVKQPLQTGIKAIDAMIPIGRGQRELIIGDRQTGKTALLIDTILSQKTSGGGDPEEPRRRCCASTSRWGRSSRPWSTWCDASKRPAPWRTRSSVSASANDEASMQYLAAYAGCSMGERFRDEGRHVVIMYDDLYKQALAYRQVMLLLRRPPGREAFPGDVFNLHSRCSSARPSSRSTRPSSTRATEGRRLAHRAPRRRRRRKATSRRTSRPT
jgi:proton translocating ATP synthase F1 alpha subunit